MSRFTKYKLYQKYETRGSQEAIPCYPNVFSIDGDGTMPLVIVEENSRDCGYTGETQPIYRWYTLPIDTYYYCDACQDAQYKWVNLPISQDWECVGTTKYYKQKKQVSVDGGSTWTDVEPPQYQRGALYEQNSSSCGYRTRTTTGSPYCIQYDKYVDVYNQVSSDGGNTWQTTATTPTMVEHNSEYCGYIEPQYRTTTGSPYCEQYDKYVPVYSQVSYDGGITWETTATTPTMVEHNSAYCGYVPPAHKKLVCNYSNGTSYSADCDSNTTLTSGDTRPSGYYYGLIKSAEIGDCITSIGESAFYQCSLSSCTIGTGVTSIGGSAFTKCYSLTSITIPDSVTSIGDYSFNQCSGMTTCTIGSGVTSIGKYAFTNCRSLTSIVIPDSVTSMGIRAFFNCSGLTSVTIGSGLTSIGIYAFTDCDSLTSITIPDTITSIGGFAFYSCSSLTSVTIGTSVTSIGDSAFQYCYGLTSITVNAVTPPTLGGWVFSDTNNCPIYVPSGSVSAYKSVWSDYASRIQAIP